MSRLVAISKGLYYPTELRVVAGIARQIRLSIPAGTTAPFRFIDNTCGTGRALYFLAHLLASPLACPLLPPEISGEKGAKNFKGGIELYGVELESERAEEAGELLTYSLCADARTVKLSERSFDLCFLNPPYDQSDGDRLEHLVLQWATPPLRPGGILILVIPGSSLEVCAGWLSRHFEKLSAWRFPLPEYERFGQVVVMGTRKRVKHDNLPLADKLAKLEAGTLPPLPCPSSEEFLELLAESGLKGPEIQAELSRLKGEVEHVEGAVKPRYLLLPNPKAPAKVVFHTGEYNPVAAMLEAEKAGVWTRKILREEVLPAPATLAKLETLLPPRIGHSSLLVTSGLLNNQVLADGNGKPVLVKGRTEKRWVVREVKKDEEGREVSRTEREELASSIQALDLKTGEFEEIGKEKLRDFISRYRASIQSAMLKNYPPLYNESDPLVKKFRESLRLLSPARKPLGGQAVAMVATALALEKLGYGLIVAEQGAGKTTMAAGAAFISGCRRVIVVCPTHLVEKWLREVKVALPGAEGVIARRVGDLEEARKRILARERELERRARRMPGEKPSPLFFVIISKEMMKLGCRWRPAVVYHPPREYPRHSETGGLVRQEGKLLVYPHCPRCDAVVEDEEGKVLGWEEPSKLKRRCDKCGEMLWQYTATPPLAAFQPQTGGYFGRKQLQPAAVPLEPNLHAGYEYLKARFVRPASALRKKLKPAVSTYPAPTGPRRWPLAEYIKHKLPGFFDLFIGDEVHQMKGKNAAQGIAASSLAASCTRRLVMTGTLGGGYSTNLFQLILRFLDPRIHQEFEPHEELRWAWLYGIIERTIREEEGEEVLEDGAMSDRRSTRVFYKEAPGLNPSILLWLVGCSVFLRLSDVSRDLPPYTEHVVRLPMAGSGEQNRERQQFSQHQAYQKLSESLYAEVKKQLALGSTRLLGALVNSLLAWPDNPTVSEVVVDPKIKAVVASGLALPANVLYPKELALLRLYLQTRAAGEKLLVFISNTQKRDLAPRLKWVLDKAWEVELVLKHAQKLGVEAKVAQLLVPLIIHKAETHLPAQEEALAELCGKLEMYLERAKKLGLVKAGEPESRVAILKGSVKAESREKWVRERVEAGADALICHPQLVETGLDLLWFTRLCFYQVIYNTYVLRQASRRSWRIGQTKPVKVYHFCYADSAQEKALVHIARKMQAAGMLDGTLEATGLVAVAEEGGEDNLALELARELVKEHEETEDGADPGMSMELLLNSIVSKEEEESQFMDMVVETSEKGPELLPLNLQTPEISHQGAEKPQAGKQPQTDGSLRYPEQAPRKKARRRKIPEGQLSMFEDVA